MNVILMRPHMSECIISKAWSLVFPPSPLISKCALYCLPFITPQSDEDVGQFFCHSSCHLPCFGAYKHPSHFWPRWQYQSSSPLSPIRYCTKLAASISCIFIKLILYNLSSCGAIAMASH